MANIIIFTTLCGLGLKEWRGAGTPAMRLLALFLLVGSTMNRWLRQLHGNNALIFVQLASQL
jgi:hypothetical protein